LLCVRAREEIAPKCFCLAMELQHRVFAFAFRQLNAAHSFFDPVQEELRGTFADVTFAHANVHIKRRGRGEAKRLWLAADRADEEPAAFGKCQFAEARALSIRRYRDGAHDFSIMHNLERWNQVAARQDRKSVV